MKPRSGPPFDPASLWGGRGVWEAVSVLTEQRQANTLASPVSRGPEHPEARHLGSEGQTALRPHSNSWETRVNTYTLAREVRGCRADGRDGETSTDARDAATGQAQPRARIHLGGLLPAHFSSQNFRPRSV